MLKKKITETKEKVKSNATITQEAQGYILSEKSEFEMVEAYKSIRTNVMFSMPKTDKGKVLVVTSSAPGEGKTSTSINLAITFAEMGAKVLLMDCDLRKARVHRYLRLENGEGITNVLCGFTDFDNAVKKNVRKNLDCLTSGVMPPNPAELLETAEFSKLLERLKENYDYILIDTPPITVVTDAAVVIKQSMGVVVVTKQNVTTYDLLDVAMEEIDKSGVKVLGFVMLGTENKSKRYGYYGDYVYRENERAEV